MALSVKNQEADRLARELADTTGESITEAVLVALRERLERERGRSGMVAGLNRLVEELAAYPVLDHRLADEILGYDERGLPR
jgi:antitoxin VapB